MTWNEIKNNIISDPEIAKILYNLDECYFEETVMIDQIDELNESEKQEIIDEYNTMGCIIKNNNIYFPAKLPFKLEIGSKVDPNAYYISRKGISAGIYYPDELEVHIEITENGKKCIELSKALYTTVSNAYDIVKTTENIFKVNIIKDK